MICVGFPPPSTICDKISRVPVGGFPRSATGSALNNISLRPLVAVLRFTAANPFTLVKVTVPRNGLGKVDSSWFTNIAV